MIEFHTGISIFTAFPGKSNVCVGFPHCHLPQEYLRSLFLNLGKLNRDNQFLFWMSLEGI
jgi:hypothetical protein